MSLMSPTGHDSDPNDPRARPVDDDVVRGRDGRPLRDRYGRPVRRRRPVPPPADAGRSGGGSRAAGDGRISGADRAGRAGRAERLSRADRADRAGRDGLDGLDGSRGRHSRRRSRPVPPPATPGRGRSDAAPPSSPSSPASPAPASPLDEPIDLNAPRPPRRPRHAAPGDATPRAAAPRDATPRDATPRTATPRDAARHAAPRDDLARDATPRRAATPPGGPTPTPPRYVRADAPAPGQPPAGRDGFPGRTTPPVDGRAGGGQRRPVPGEIPSRRDERARRPASRRSARRGDRQTRNTPGAALPRGPRTPHGLRGRGPGRGRADAVGRPRRLVKKRYILAVVLVLILAVPVVMAFRVDGNLQRIDALKDYDGRPADSAGTNWLLVGTDSREGLSEADGARLAAGDITATGARTDSIIVVHVPRFGGKATMLSIPRDSYVDIPGWGKDKINTSFNEGGPALLQQTVEQSTGLRIDHYAEIGFGGFATIVDAVGGIELCPKEPIDDPMAGINLQPGCQTMDGPTALGYVRTRYTSANGDLDRVQRQREFLSAITHKIGSAGTVVNPFRSLPLADAFSKALTIDDDDHLWNLGALALALARGANQETVPVAGFEGVDVGNVVVWDDAAAQQLFASLR